MQLDYVWGKRAFLSPATTRLRGVAFELRDVRGIFSEIQSGSGVQSLAEICHTARCLARNNKKWRLVETKLRITEWFNNF